MKARNWIVAGLAFGLFATANAEPGRVSVSHFEPLQKLSIDDVDGVGPTVMKFDALGQSFDLELEPNLGFLSPEARAGLPQGIGVYRGAIAGRPGSWARIVVYDGRPSGMIWDGREMFAVEAPADGATSEPVVYRLADVSVAPGSMTCGTHEFSGSGAAVYKAIVGEIGERLAQGPGAVTEIDIGQVADFEFTSANGGDSGAAAEIVTRMNIVDGIYSQQIGVQINVPLIDTFNDINDPFTESDASLLIDEVATYRDTTPAQNALGLTHLWTGRDLDGSTVGIAFENVLCRQRVGAGLSEGNIAANFDAIIAAHEIGHNFGAPHDGVPGPCESEPQTFIMAPSVGANVTAFSQCSVDIMVANAAQASCIRALPTVDMSVRLTGQPPTAFLTNTLELTIDLQNQGGSQATNVVADITLPVNVTFESVTTSAGSCTIGAGTVSCQLGDVPGQTTRTVTLTTTATSTGSGSFDAVVSADTDERAGNNQASVQLTVNPAVNLVATNPSQATINLDQGTVVQTTIANTSTLDATDVSLSLSFSNGLRPDTATWTAGTCTIGPQQVDCTAATIAGQTSSMLTIGVTGTTAGTRSYSGTLASNETDADISDNSVTGSVRINDPNNDDSGGGSPGLPLLLLLLGSLIARRRSQPCQLREWI